MPLAGCATKPCGRGGLIADDAFALGKQASDAELGSCETPLRRRPELLGRLREVLPHTRPYQVELAEFIHRFGTTLAGGAPKPSGRRGVILRNTERGAMQSPEGHLRLDIPRLGSQAIEAGAVSSSRDTPRPAA